MVSGIAYRNICDFLLELAKLTLQTFIRPCRTDRNEPGHEKMCLMSYANNKGADQPAHPLSLISAFVVYSIISLDSIAEISRFYKVASFCGCTGRFVSGLYGNSRRHVLSCCGSNKETDRNKETDPDNARLVHVYIPVKVQIDGVRTYKYTTTKPEEEIGLTVAYIHHCLFPIHQRLN